MINTELLKKNREIIGLIGEKIIINHFYSLGLPAMADVDPFSPFDIHVKENGEELKVQVKTTTPYFKYNVWKIDFSKTGENIVNLFSADKLFIISLPVNNLHRFGFERHLTDGCIIQVDTKMLNEKDNISDEFNSFVLHRDNHSHMFKIVRPLTNAELNIIQKYPTTGLSVSPKQFVKAAK